MIKVKHRREESGVLTAKNKSGGKTGMKKQTNRRDLFPGSFIILFLAVAVFALSGCGNEQKQAPAAKKAQAPVEKKRALPGGHPALKTTTDDIAKASHSQIKTKKAVKISDEVRKKWTAVTLEISDMSAKARKAVKLKVGSTTQLTDDGYEVKIEVLVPDYAINGDHIESRSNEAKNPAVLIDLMKGGKVETRGWIFTQFPEFNSFNNKRFRFVLKEPALVK